MGRDNFKTAVTLSSCIFRLYGKDMFGKRKIRLALVDLNGTCHVGNDLVGNSSKAISDLLENQIRVKYVTNTTKGIAARL